MSRINTGYRWGGDARIGGVGAGAARLEPKPEDRLEKLRREFDGKEFRVTLADQIEIQTAFESKLIGEYETKKITLESQIGALEGVREAVEKLNDALSYLRNPLDINDNAFARKNVNITTSDSLADYISVETTSGAEDASFTVNVSQLATADTLSIGTADLALATAVNTAIQNKMTTVDAAVADAQAAAGPLDAAGMPTNPYSKALYQLSLSAQASGMTLGALKAQATTMLTQMQTTHISSGFSSLSAQAVTAGGLGQTLNAGSYLVYSAAGGHQVAKNITTMSTATSQVYDAIMALPGPNIAQADVQAAVNAVFAGLGLGAYTPNAPPASSILNFASTIADRAYNAAGAGGALVATVQAAVAAVATTANFNQAASDYFNNAYPSGSEQLKNQIALSVLQAISNEATRTGSNIDTISTAATTQYTTFLGYCTITLNAGDTTQNVIDKINATSLYSGIAAEAIQNGPGSYIIRVSSNNTGLDYKMKILDTGTFADSSATLFGSTVNYELQPQNSNSLVDGMFISSPSNVINYNPKVIISLKKANSSLAVSQTVTLSPNTAAAYQYIKGFVDAYNLLALEIAKQTERDTVTFMPKDTALLAANDNVRAIKNCIDTAIVSGFPFATSFKSLMDVGITNSAVKSDGTNPGYKSLVIDDEVLARNLTGDYSGVVKLFQFSFDTSNPILQITRHDGLYAGITKLRVSVNPAANGAGVGYGPDHLAVKIEFLNPDGTNVLNPDASNKIEYYPITIGAGVSSIQITDPSSSLYGMSFAYTAAGTTGGIIITPNQGFADLLYNSLYPYTDSRDNPLSGVITQNEQTLLAQMKTLDIALESKRRDLARRTRQIEERAAVSMTKATNARAMTKALNAILEGERG